MDRKRGSIITLLALSAYILFGNCSISVSVYPAARMVQHAIDQGSYSVQIASFKGFIFVVQIAMCPKCMAIIFSSLLLEDEPNDPFLLVLFLPTT